MPRLWTQTIETHRREVAIAIVDTTVALVAEHGLRAVTMSRIAEQAGIGRATLYKYYPDVESILVAWHQRHAAERLERLGELRDRAGNAGQALTDVLAAITTHLQHEAAKHGLGTDLVALVHKDEHIQGVEQQLHQFLQDTIAAAATAGFVRTDTPPSELASYCLHALTAARQAPTKAAANRLLNLTLSAVQPS